MLSVTPPGWEFFCRGADIPVCRWVGRQECLPHGKRREPTAGVEPAWACLRDRCLSTIEPRRRKQRRKESNPTTAALLNGLTTLDAACPTRSTPPSFQGVRGEMPLRKGCLPKPHNSLTVVAIRLYRTMTFFHKNPIQNPIHPTHTIESRLPPGRFTLFYRTPSNACDTSLFNRCAYVRSICLVEVWPMIFATVSRFIPFLMQSVQSL